MHNHRPEESQALPDVSSSSEGLGSFFGTIGGPVRDNDPTKAKYRDRVKPPTEKPNVKANPGKKGSGYGYSSSIIRLSLHLSLSLVSFPHLGLEKDPPYVYKDKTNSFDAPLELTRVKILFDRWRRVLSLFFF